MLQREDLAFESHGTECRGYLYRPENASGDVPCIVMGHGFAATRDSGLAPFAEAFAAAGYAAFVFDYRHFGASGGHPRQLLVPEKELQDWQSAINFVRELDGIHAGEIALWGTSFGGGLVTVAAARDGNVQAIIAQCPMMDGAASVMSVIGYAGLGMGLKLTAHGTLDILRAGLGMSPHYIASAGRPGEVAAMSASDCYDGYSALLPKGAPNKVAARVAATLMLFRPISVAAKVRCPALVLICDTDTVAPPASAEKAAAKMPHAEVKHYAVGHFDIYQGEAREESLRDQLAFLQRHLKGSAKRQG
jgi:cephalosporin-C deacetylase-like acetyl esterase|tara:strand:- start:163701 stop:164615 length:915 start_codon:yes stop_codon:yes gene_type:complete